MLVQSATTLCTFILGGDGNEAMHGNYLYHNYLHCALMLQCILHCTIHAYTSRRKHSYGYRKLSGCN